MTKAANGMTRRAVLTNGLVCAATLVTGSRSSPASTGTHGRMGPKVTGALRCDDEVLGAAADDFGHIVHHRPRAVLSPASASDIAAVTRWAAAKGMKVAARGQGHSTYGRAMTDGGIVLDMSTINTISHVGPDHIQVDAGATWRAVLNASLSQGLTPPVLTNYLGLSVGGTLTVGGIGGSTSRNGMQTDNVLELDVVTGDGRQLTCSADRNADLFNAVRGGLAQCAIITRATLRLIRAPERVLRMQLFYPNLHSLTNDQLRVLSEGRFDQLQGAILPGTNGDWRYQLDGAVFYSGDAIPNQQSLLAGLSDDRSAAVVSDLTYLEDASAFDRIEGLLRANGQWANPHPWWLTFLRGSNAESLATATLEGLSPTNVGPFGRITYYPMHTRALRTPLVRMPEEEVAFTFNIIRLPASNDAVETGRMIDSNRALYDSVRDAGAVLYPVSAFPMRPSDWRNHFGAAWPLLCEARKRFDRHHALTPGYEVF